MNSEIVSKVKKIKESLPEVEVKLKNKKDKLKESKLYLNIIKTIPIPYLVNHENLRLLERINQLEMEKKERSDGSLLIRANNSESIIDKTMKDEMSGNTIDRMDISRIAANRSLINRKKNQNVNNQSINITEMIEDNELLKEKFENLKTLKDKLKLSKKENKFMSNKIAQMNTLFFNLTKIFTEGVHEISKELLKIHEIQLDKIVQSKT